MEFDENLNPIVPPTSQPNPWNPPQPYQEPARPTVPSFTPPTTTSPLAPPAPQPTPPAPAPFFPLPPTPPIKPTPIESQPKLVSVFPIGNMVIMMFVITLVAMILAFAGDWFDLGRTREISVSGTGTAYSAPDVAKIDFGVRSSARDLATSQRMNADAIAKIKTDLVPFEISPEDIQTINYNINPDYIYSAAQKPTLSGYTTYHFLRLTMRRLDTVDAILQTLGNSGVTDISQISFTIEDPADVKNEAREKAILAAKDMATQLATLSGAKLGNIISIQEITTPSDINPRAYDGMGGGMGGGPGVEQGSLSITSTVTLTYSLK